MKAHYDFSRILSVDAYQPIFKAGYNFNLACGIDSANSLGIPCFNKDTFCSGNFREVTDSGVTPPTRLGHSRENDILKFHLMQFMMEGLISRGSHGVVSNTGKT